MEELTIQTKITRIEGNTVVVKACVIREGDFFEAHGTYAFIPEQGIIGAIEQAEDKAVERATKLAYEAESRKK